MYTNTKTLLVAPFLTPLVLVAACATAVAMPSPDITGGTDHPAAHTSAVPFGRNFDPTTGVESTGTTIDTTSGGDQYGHGGALSTAGGGSAGSWTACAGARRGRSSCGPPTDRRACWLS